MVPTALIYVCAYLDFFSSCSPRNWFCLVMPLRLFKDCVIFHHLPELQWVHWNKCPDAPFPENKGIYACLWGWGQLVLLLAGPQMLLFWGSEKGLIFMWISQDMSILILHLKILFECGGLGHLEFWQPNRCELCDRNIQGVFDMSQMCQIHMMALNTVHPQALYLGFVRHGVSLLLSTILPGQPRTEAWWDAFSGTYKGKNTLVLTEW